MRDCPGCRASVLRRLPPAPLAVGAGAVQDRSGPSWPETGGEPAATGSVVNNRVSGKGHSAGATPSGPETGDNPAATGSVVPIGCLERGTAPEPPPPGQEPATIRPRQVPLCRSGVWKAAQAGASHSGPETGDNPAATGSVVPIGCLESGTSRSGPTPGQKSTTIRQRQVPLCRSGVWKAAQAGAVPLRARNRRRSGSDRLRCADRAFGKFSRRWPSSCVSLGDSPEADLPRRQTKGGWLGMATQWA